MQDIKSIKHKALYFLSRREHSYSELLNKLRRYSDDIDLIQQVLDQLKEQKLLSEERYIQSYLSSKANKYGITKLKYELSSKIDDSELINHIITESQIDQYEVAFNIWKKKFNEKPKTPKEQQQQMRFLLNRGFSFEIIQKVINGRK